MTCVGSLAAAPPQSSPTPPVDVVCAWYKLALALVRHTATYSPPVASRTFAYLGIVAFEATASGDGELQSLAGQLNGLKPGPKREAGQTYDDALVLDAAMQSAVQDLFANTGPTGQRAMTALAEKLHGDVAAQLPADVAARSEAYGRAVAEHILAWSRDDGGAVVENMGFPQSYDVNKDPAHWKPTSLIAQQQAPLLPNWGKNRTFAMPDGATCSLPPPPEYSEDKNSEFYKEAMEVYQTRLNLTPQTTRHRAVLGRRRDAFGHPAGALGFDCAANYRARQRRARKKRRCVGACRDRPLRCVCRMLERQIPI